MPFKSKQQMRYLYKMKPDIAKKWHDETKAEGKKFPKKKYVKGRKSTSPQLAKLRKKKGATTNGRRKVNKGTNKVSRRKK